MKDSFPLSKQTPVVQLQACTNSGLYKHRALIIFIIDQGAPVTCSVLNKDSRKLNSAPVRSVLIPVYGMPHDFLTSTDIVSQCTGRNAKRQTTIDIQLNTKSSPKASHPN